MDKKFVGLVGAVVAMAPLGAAQAMPTTTADAGMKANTFADLLTPIPNAVDKLQASDALLTERAANAAKIEMAQYYYHHHHRFFRRFFHHHHHHHFYRHHHHHHHFYN